MTELTEEQHAGEFIVTEANGSLSRESATVLSGQNLKAGHVLGKVAVGTASGAAVSGNTGNGAISAVSAGATAKAGVYTATCIEPAANGGTFTVEDPDGVNVGTAVVGTPFAGPVNFTIADGATDFAAGDRFAITVAAGSGKYKEYNPANTDGSEIPVAILYASVDATGGDAEGVVIARHAEVNAAELIWFSGADANQKSAGLAQLKTHDIIAR
ncbi:MAG: head decoration protein [Alphaproteobacteria bacterium PRO2]|nr:head decoration protein [Alphaproteobacteria bacterium PRO2]